MFVLTLNNAVYLKYCVTLRANCFKRLYFTNCLMLFKTDISIGISDASPPSLTHGCAEKLKQIKTIIKNLIARKRLLQKISSSDMAVNS